MVLPLPVALEHDGAARAPPGAPTPAPTLLAFSLEQDRWPAWAGVAARNAFTHSALAAYAALTGRPPKLRVGADSEDRTVWAPTVTVRPFLGPLSGAEAEGGARAV